MLLQDNVGLEELIDAFWDFVSQLKRGRQRMALTRESVAGMVTAMLNWGSAELSFIRRVRRR